MTAPLVLAADVGRTTCRVAMMAAGGTGTPGQPSTVEVPSGASLTDPDGVDVVLAAIEMATAQLPAAGDRAAITGVAVGAAGATQSSRAAAALADALHGRYPAATVRVTSDVVAAHIGALEGRPGVLAIAGTGAVALAIAADGSHRQVDGWGYLLGDEGSGLSIGRAGLAAALRHHDGRPGGSPALAAEASRAYGSLDGLVAAIQGDRSAVRQIAAFVPQVAAAARAGDGIATDIFETAVAELATTIGTAIAHVRAHGGDGDPVEVATTGGLTHLDDLLLAPLTRAVTSRNHGVRFLSAVRDGVAGSLRLASATTPIHGRLVVQRP